MADRADPATVRLGPGFLRQLCDGSECVEQAVGVEVFQKLRVELLRLREVVVGV